MNYLFALPGAFLALLFLSLPGFSTPRDSDLKRDLKRAKAVVAGEVTRLHSYYAPDGEIYSDITLRVSGVLKESEATPGLLTFTTPGGIVGEEGVAFSNAPWFEVNEPVLLLLEEWAPGTLSPAAKYDLDGRDIPEVGLKGRALLETVRSILTEQGNAVLDSEWQRTLEFEKTSRKAGADPTTQVENPLTACYVLTGPRWRTTSVQFRLDNALPPDMSTAALAAVKTINDLNLSVRFQSSAFSSNLISRGGITTGNPSTLAVARYRFIPSTQTMVDYTITLNNLYTWASTGAPGVFDTEGVLLHELGHIAGLNHPSPTICNQHTMWFSVAAGDTSRRTLEIGDTTGLQTIYGTVAPPPPPPPSAPPSAPPPAANPGSTPPVPTLTGITVSGNLVTNSTIRMSASGTNFAEFLQFVVRGQGCPSTGCILAGAAVQNITATSASTSFVPRGAGTYRVNVRNTALGAQSAAQASFMVFIR